MSKLEWTRADPRPSRSAPAFSQIEWISAPNCNTLPFFGVRGWGEGVSGHSRNCIPHRFTHPGFFGERGGIVLIRERNFWIRLFRRFRSRGFGDLGKWDGVEAFFSRMDEDSSIVSRCWITNYMNCALKILIRLYKRVNCNWNEGNIHLIITVNNTRIRLFILET